MIKSAKIYIRGIVQGVGFRPFIYNLANYYNLSGWCLNTTQGVEVVVEGNINNIHKFFNDVEKKAPLLSIIEAKKIKFIKPKNYKTFEILKSKKEKGELILISPDVSVCPECLQELFYPPDRRYLYPFINCVNCGPRFTIIFDIPYDRKNTTMSGFKMCKNCEREYENHRDRRYHAEPNACGVCGPYVELYKSQGKPNGVQKIKTKDPIKETQKLLKKGKIFAIKGLGGFHLAVDATNHNAVKKLKERKKREKDKPLAIMMKDVDEVEKICQIDKVEKEILNSQARPIILLEKKDNCPIADEVAPKNKYLGIMLPYTPLHFLLLNPQSAIRNPQSMLVMTSANTSEEPIVKDNKEAIKKLSLIADYFLLHNREIFSRADDSVIRMINKNPVFIRRSRGYVPYPIRLNFKLKQILGVGAELKNTFCLTKNNYAFLSQHIGDLKNYETYKYFEEAIEQFKNFFRINPQVIAYDMHPEYLSTKYALQKRHSMALVAVQHHHAHSVSCMVENGILGEVIGISFDGTGYGEDGKIWGSEFLVCNFGGYQRMAHLKYLPLLGGDAAIKNPYRTAVSYLYNVYGREILNIKIRKKRLFELFGISEKEINSLVLAREKNINTPEASSCGRLFDAVSSLIGICFRTNYEGQAAQELEWCATKYRGKITKIYNYKIKEEKPLIIEVDDMFREIIEDMEKMVDNSIIAYKFHLTIAAFTQEICRRIREKTNINKVVLSGGSFQNKILTEMIMKTLTRANFEVFTHKLVPPNDGGISLGQVVIANEKIKNLTNW